jgi:hypothetical protein
MNGSRLAAVVLLAATASAPGAAAQTLTFSADPRTRCVQLVEFWVRHGGSKSEGGTGSDTPRKSAEFDCGTGRYDTGIRTMEDLLRRNGYTIPPA